MNFIVMILFSIIFLLPSNTNDNPSKWPTKHAHIRRPLVLSIDDVSQYKSRTFNDLN